MKLKCSNEKCLAEYFHNSIRSPPKTCRFCGGVMVKVRMTNKEIEEIYMSGPFPGKLREKKEAKNGSRKT